MSSLKQLGLAIHMYSQDHGGRFPSVGGPRGEGGLASLQLLYDRYASDARLFLCPHDKTVTPWDGLGHLARAHCSYGYDHSHDSSCLADVAVAADYDDIVGRPGGMPSRHRKYEGTNVLYADGHVKWCVERNVGHRGDDIYARSETLSPAEDSWITQ